MHKRFKQNENDTDKVQNDEIWNLWNSSNTSNLYNLNQDIYSNNDHHYHDNKMHEVEGNDRQSDITNDKSNASVIIKNDYYDRLSQICDTTPFER